MVKLNVVEEDVLFIIFFLFFSIAIGILGYRLFVGFDWFKSLYNSAFILSGTGVPDKVENQTGQLFIAAYSLYGGIVFLIIIGVIIGRVVSIQVNGNN